MSNDTGIDITWRSSSDDSIGWCNLCQSPVYSEDDPCACGLHKQTNKAAKEIDAALALARGDK